MAAKKPTPQQQKAKREKLLLAVLGVVLLAVVGFQLPKLLGSKGSPTAAPPATTPAGGSLAAASGAAQLRQFTRFAAKDPFVSRGPSVASSAPPAPKPPAIKPKPAPKPPATLTITPTKPAQVVPTGPMVPAALLRLNGKKTVVPLGTTFPAKNPLFRLIAISPKAIWLELIGGTLANGKHTFKLTRGHPLKLENTTAGTRFELAMVKPTTAPKPVPTVTVSTPTTTQATTTATTPATTTTSG
jgi:hypothetical protein